MVTPRTGRPPGRPNGSKNKNHRPLRDDPLAIQMALAEALQMGLNVSAQQARALAVVELSAEKTEFSGNLSKKMRASLERCGGTIVSYDISMLGGDIYERDLSKRIQPIDTLQKKTKREFTEADIEYLATLSSCFFVALFGKGSFETRAISIRILSKSINEEALGARLIEAMRLADQKLQ